MISGLARRSGRVLKTPNRLSVLNPQVTSKNQESFVISSTQAGAKKATRKSGDLGRPAKANEIIDIQAFVGNKSMQIQHLLIFIQN
jgi:hypothetical protein